MELGVDYSAELTTLIVFTLEEVGKGVLLTVTESGFDGIPMARRAEAVTDQPRGLGDAALEHRKECLRAVPRSLRAAGAHRAAVRGFGWPDAGVPGAPPRRRGTALHRAPQRRAGVTRRRSPSTCGC